MLKKSFSRLLLIIGLIFTSSFFLFRNSGVYGAPITETEANKKLVNNLRYGYDLTGDTPLFNDGLKKNYPILVNMDSGLWQKVNRKEVNSDSKPMQYKSNDPIDVLVKHSDFLSAGNNTKASINSFKFDRSFNRTKNFDQIYDEEFDIYYEKVDRFEYYLDDTSDFRNYLSDAFKDDLYNVIDENSANKLFDKYGTHLLTSLVYGAVLELTNYQATASNTFKINKESYLNEIVKNSTESQSFYIETSKYKEISNDQEVNRYNIINYGGEDINSTFVDFFNVDLNKDSNGSKYKQWKNSVNLIEENSLAITGTNSKSIPLWELYPNYQDFNEQRKIVYNAYVKRCEKVFNNYKNKYLSENRYFDDEVNDISGKFVGAVVSNDNISFNQLISTENYINRGNEITLGYDVTKDNGSINVQVKEGNVKKVNEKENTFLIDPEAVVGSKISFILTNGEDILDTVNFIVSDNKFAGGNGSIQSPYLISNIAEYMELMNNEKLWGLNFKLINDINFNEKVINPIGNKEFNFTGNFDGNNYTIYNFKLEPRKFTGESKNENLQKNNAFGLFGYNSGNIMNLNIGKKDVVSSVVAKENFDISDDFVINYAGILVGFNSGNIQNIRIINTNIDIQEVIDKDGEFYLGGLVGFSQKYKNNCSIKNIAIENIGLIKGLEYGLGRTRSYTITNDSGILAGKIDGTDLSNILINNINSFLSGVYVYDVTFNQGLLVGEAINASLSNCIVGKVNEALYSINCGKNVQYVVNRNLLIGKVDEAFKVENSIINKYVSNTHTNIENGNISSEGLKVVDNVLDEVIDSKIFKVENSIIYLNTLLNNEKLNIKSNINIDTTNFKKEYYVGQSFNPYGIKFSTTDNLGNIVSLDSYKINYSGFHNNISGQYDINFEVLGHEFSVKVTVRKLNVIDIIINTNKNVFYDTDKLNTDDFSFKYLLEDGTILEYGKPSDEVNLPLDQNILIESDKLVGGKNKINFTIGDLKKSYSINVVEDRIKYIGFVKYPNKDKYSIGDKVDLNGSIIQAYYESGKEEIVPLEDIEISNNIVNNGLNEIYLSYKNYDYLTLNIKINPYVYKVSFENNGEIIDEYFYTEGDKITYPTTPSKPKDEIYQYKFTGWSEEKNSVGDSVKYIAQYEKEYRTYNVKFIVDDNVIVNKDYKMSESIVFPEDPIKQEDKKYKYVFNGWEMTELDDGDVIYTAKFKNILLIYNVRFIVGSNIISDATYSYGDEIKSPDDPVKKDTEILKYVFVGWQTKSGDVFDNVCKGDADYYAIFDEIYKTYNVKVIIDGKIESDIDYKVIEEPILPDNPIKESDNYFVYSFSNWEEEILQNGDRIYTAIFTKETRYFSVKFKNGDNVLSDKLYTYGEDIILPEDPTKESDNYGSYTFIMWKDLENNTDLNLKCNKDVIYTALFECKYIDYTITYKYPDGSIMAIQKYHYNDLITEPDIIKYKENDLKFEYTFSGWDRKINEKCVGNETYTANFDKEYKIYIVEYYDENNVKLDNLTQKYHYGDKINLPMPIKIEPSNEFVYNDIHWNIQENMLITENVKVNLSFKKELRKYKVLFYNKDNKLIYTTEVEYGKNAQIPDEIIEQISNSGLYQFKGWNQPLENIKQDTIFTPVYKVKTIYKFIIPIPLILIIIGLIVYKYKKKNK